MQSSITYETLAESKVDGVPARAVLNRKGQLEGNWKPGVHALVIGAMGSGKTMTFINPMIQCIAATNCGSSMIMTDPKGELFDLHSGFLKERGYEVMVLDLRDTYSSSRWNPLEPIWDSYQESVHVSDGLILHLESMDDFPELRRLDGAVEKGEPWIEWKGNAYADPEHCRDDINVARQKINKALSNSENKYKTLKDYFEGRGRLSQAYQLSRQVLSAPDNTMSSYMSVTLDKLNIFNDRGLCGLTSATDLRADKLAFGKTAVFLKIPDEKDTRHALASLFTAMLGKMGSAFDRLGGTGEAAAVQAVAEPENGGIPPELAERLAAQRAAIREKDAVIEEKDAVIERMRLELERLRGGEARDKSAIADAPERTESTPPEIESAERADAPTLGGLFRNNDASCDGYVDFEGVLLAEGGKGENISWATDRLTSLPLTTDFSDAYARHAMQHGAGKTLAVRLDFADAYGAGLEALANAPSDAAKTLRGMGLAETVALTLRYTDRYGAVREAKVPAAEKVLAFKTSGGSPRREASEGDAAALVTAAVYELAGADIRAAIDSGSGALRYQYARLSYGDVGCRRAAQGREQPHSAARLRARLAPDAARQHGALSH